MLLNNQKTLQGALLLLTILSQIQGNKLTPTKAEVSYYSDTSKLITGNFEYYIKGNNVQYGTRFGVDIYKVRTLTLFYFKKILIQGHNRRKLFSLSHSTRIRVLCSLHRTPTQLRPQRSYQGTLPKRS